VATQNLRQPTLVNDKTSCCGSPGKTKCSSRISAVLQLFEGKWTIQILCEMRKRPVRLSELKREIPSASKKALTARLRLLEIAGIVVRNDLSDSLLHVEYEVAEAMRVPLAEILDELKKWGENHESAIAPILQSKRTG